MKSFSQFLRESYIAEAQVTYSSVTPSGRVRNKQEQEAYTQTTQRDLETERIKSQRQPSGAAADPSKQFKPKETTTKVQGSDIQGKPPQEVQGRLLSRNNTPPNKPGELATRSTTTPVVKPPQGVEVRDVTNPRKAAAELKARQAAAGTGPSGKPIITPPSTSQNRANKVIDAVRQSRNRSFDAMKAQWNQPIPRSRLPGKALGVAGAGLDVGLEYASQTERGRSAPTALGMGATKAAGGWAGSVAGAKAGAALGAGVGAMFGGVGAAPGAAIGGALGGIGGYIAGSELTGGATETIAGATGKEKVAMAQANRQRQAGGGIAGIGGKTTFSQKKPGGPAFMSTGKGSQRRTVQLAKTSVIRGPGGKEDLGYLAFKDGKAVYKRAADPSTLARTSSNWAERVGRTFFGGAYAKHDAEMKAKKLAAARQSDVRTRQKLGIKFGPGR